MESGAGGDMEQAEAERRRAGEELRRARERREREERQEGEARRALDERERETEGAEAQGRCST